MPRILNSDKQIKRALKKFDSRRDPEHRYSSFDYCYGYFQSFRKNKNKIADSEHLEMSCLQLAFYLASWGMYRGSTFLSKNTSSKFFIPLIKWLAMDCPDEIWKIDVNNYNNDKMKLLKDVYKSIENILGKDNNFKPTKTLITKIMLGVFGNTPAFDNLFTTTFRKYYYGKPSFKSLTLNYEELLKVKEFYTKNKKLIEKQRKLHKLFNFLSGKEAKIIYSRAKIIDMIGFGYRLSN